MKKITFLVVFFFIQTNFSFGQYSSYNPQFGWGDWHTDNCFKGIFIRAQKAYFNKGANEWYWNWEIQNRYNRKVAISWRFYNNTKGKPEYTNSRHTFEVGETLTNGGFGSEHELSYMSSDICFEFTNVNGYILDDCSSDPSTYKKNYYFGNCDNGTPNYKKYNGSNNNSENQTNNSKSSNQNNSLNNSTNTSSNQQNNEEIAAQKAADEKRQQFEGYMESGNNQLSSENYNAAINSYTNAANIAPTSSDLQTANNAIANAQKLKADAARKVRTDKKREVEKSNNQTANTLTGAVATIMTLLKDRYSDNPFACKLQLGLGMENLPLIANSAKKNMSLTTTSLHELMYCGFKLGFANTKGVSFNINPMYIFGINYGQPGYDGIHNAYGSTATILIGKKAKSHFKLFIEGGYLGRSGNMNYDQDVAEGSSSATDNVEVSKYKYSVIKYGGGIMFQFINKMDKETFIKPGIFLEKPSYTSSSKKPILVSNLVLNIASTIQLDISYAKTYIAGGDNYYINRYTNEDKGYWNFKIIRQAKLK